MLAHYLYSANPAELSFEDFIAFLRTAHSVEEFTLAVNDTGTIDQMCRADVGYNVAKRIDDLQANLLVPPGITRNQIEPYLAMIRSTACTDLLD